MDTRLIKPEDNKSGTLTQQLTASETTTAYVSPVPSEAPGIIVIGLGTTKEEFIYYREKDASAGTISNLVRDFTNLNGGVGQQHEYGDAYEVVQSARFITNIIDVLKEGFIREQSTVTRVDSTNFTVDGNVAVIYNVGRIIRFNQDNSYIGRVSAVSYDAGTGLTTVTVENTTVPSSLSIVEYGVQPKTKKFLTSDDIIDEDDMVSNSDTKVPVQQSVVNFVGDSTGTLYRNAIINGNLEVWQEGTSFSNPTSSGTAYCADMFQFFRSAWAGNITATQQTSNLPTGSRRSIRIQRTSGDTSTSNIYFGQAIETLNSVLLRGKKLTLSFYIKMGADFSASDITFGIGESTVSDEPVVSNTSLTYSSTQSKTTSWTKVTLTTSSPIDTTTNTVKFIVQYSPTGTAGTNDWFEITQVEINVGSVSLPFQPLPYADELRRCQRYFLAFGGGNLRDVAGWGSAKSTTQGFVHVIFPVEMRTIPTLSYSSLSDWKIADGSGTIGSITALSVSTTTSKVQADIEWTASGATQYRPYFMRANDTTNARLYFKARL